jgi:glycosyltransferase involved in cell wall biosynthesis
MMAREFKVLYLSGDEWGNLGRRKIRLAYEFARQDAVAAVLYVNPPIQSCVLDVARRQFEPSHLGEGRRAHLDALLGRSHPAGERLRVYTGSTKTLPLTKNEWLRRSPWLNEANRRLYIAGLRRQLRRLPGEKLVIWSSHPLQIEVVDAFPERCLVCYDWTDDWLQFALLPVEAQVLERAVERVLQQANVVFAVSDSLYQRARRVNSNVHRAPNATDLELLSSSLDTSQPIHPALHAVSRPRLGYIGQIGENIDYALVYAVAQARPDWSWVFVGPPWANREEEIARLGQLANVHFLGRRPHSDLPGLLRGFDLCVMPHLRNELTVSMDPTKLYDYLVSGKPIVSTAVAGTERFADILYIGDTPGEFVNGVERALAESGARLERQLEYARQNSWVPRAQEMWAIVEQSVRERVAWGPGERE